MKFQTPKKNCVFPPTPWSIRSNNQWLKQKRMKLPLFIHIERAYPIQTNKPHFINPKTSNQKEKKKRYFGHWGEEEEITCDTKIHSQKHRPNEFVAPNKGFLWRWRRWRRSSGVCPHRRRRGERVWFLLPPKLLQSRCYQSHKLWIKTTDLIWFSTIFLIRKEEGEKKNEPFRGLSVYSFGGPSSLILFFSCLSLPLHFTIQSFQISILNSTLLDTVSHAYTQSVTFFLFLIYTFFNFNHWWEGVWKNGSFHNEVTRKGLIT